ncbi:MAG: hypothetical protein KDA32_12735 [Phycisphaerales bacterium]|nr:hypothetical protein [Phycisphaerales bacterium]
MSEILQALSNPSMRHAMLVHFPIVLSILCFVAAGVHLAMGGRNRTLGIGVVALFVALLAGAWIAENSGETAEGFVGAIPDAARHRLHEHEEMAESVWMFALAGVLISGAGLWVKPRFSLAAAGLATVAGLLAAGWVGLTAHHGGTLVYAFAVGPKKPVITLAPLGPDADPRAAHFRAAVLPVIADRCFGCHGGDEPPGGLDLTTPGGALVGGGLGPAIIPGSEESPVLIAIRGGNDDIPGMPPGDDLVTPEEIEAIAQWIREGAVWQ